MALPTEPPPGFGGILLGGIIAATIGEVDPDLVPELLQLTAELEIGQRIAQPRLRYRYQEDKVGLHPSHHRLLGEGEELIFDLDLDRGLPAQQVLGAVYAAGRLDAKVRHAVMQTIRRAIRWQGAIDGDLIATLSGVGRGRPLSAFAFENPVSWAMGVLKIVPGSQASMNSKPARSEVQRCFREQLMDAHPDHGGEVADAAQRISEITEARRILLG
ncbi:MAG: hypothetical protein WCK41_04045 [Actinomycetes bacterium]